MNLHGVYYDSRSSASHDIDLILSEEGIISSMQELIEPISINNVKISSRVGNIPRNLSFPSGAVVESSDHDMIDIWLNQHLHNKGWAHRFESRMGYVLGAFMFVIIFVILGVVWGVPWVSEGIAYALPAKASSLLGEGALSSMDKLIFEPSELEVDKQAYWKERLIKLLPEDSNGIEYLLVFRLGGLIGPNAFALPDGTVVITDELLGLAEEDEEIESVLLHEIGHVVNRHSLRQIISHSGLAVFATLIAGDVSSAGAVILAAPSILMESSYSRELESEADGYSLEEMKRLNIDTNHFANFMERLEFEMFKLEAEQIEGESDEDNWMNYFSTHPPSAERIARFRTANGEN